MRLLDRYVIRNFLQAYVYCLAGFTSIWLIYDISDNISTYVEGDIGLQRVGQYYLTQLPEIFVMLFPVALLLALLFSLGRMSRANEIVSMLTAGISVVRILYPVMLAGVLTAAVSLALNYSLAPHAGAGRELLIEGNKKGRRTAIEGQIFRNRRDHRTWFIQRFQPGSNQFQNVHVLQENAQEQIITSFLAARAVYRPQTNVWDLETAKIVWYDPAGNIEREEIHPSVQITNWSETPFRLSSAHMNAESLGVRELVDYLQLNSDFPSPLLAPFKTHLYNRLAVPLTCIVVVLIAAPLGIGFSRRSVIRSVASAIVLVFSMNALAYFFLALGEGDRIAPELAAWTPIALFSVIGLFLMYSRTSAGWPRFPLFGPRRIVRG